jgi:signal transduction histidine kinase/CheY-like chemotaxis protein
MHKSILTIDIRYEHDVVLARQRARQIAGLVGFDLQDQTRISTSTSELARNVFQYVGSGRVEFGIDDGATGWLLSITVSDKGGGIRELDNILRGRYVSSTGMGLGILGAKRLMDVFSIQSTAGQGTTVSIGKAIPTKLGRLVPDPARISLELSKQTPQSPYDELQQQNQELLRALAELRKRQDELAHLNRELEDTNRGVVALYAELDERADYLQRANEVKTAFLSNMTHEFRTPLNAIQSLTNLLLDRTDGDLLPEQEKQVLFIRRSAEDLSELVNDLLDLAKVEAGKISLRAQEFRVDALFGTLRGMLKPILAYNTSVALVFDSAENIPVMNTDDRRVSQVLRNLISNALKFTSKGEVRVRAEQLSHDTIRFAVSDTGIGIADADQDRIFQEWVQLDNPLQRQVKGTGLGLPLSRRLAQLLGGTLTVESKLGLGSTFYFTVPKTYVGPDEANEDVEAESTSEGHIPVLVLEDNGDAQFVYRQFLSKTKFRVIPAKSAAEARQIIERFQPQAIIMDVLLEAEDSWPFLQEIRRSPATHNLPVIMLSVQENESRAKALGASEFALKPVNRVWLLNRLESLTTPAAAPNILIVDDDEIARYLLRNVLAGVSAEIGEASNGIEALRIVSEKRPKLIFLDLVMPDLSGIEVLDKLRASSLRDIPVVLHTSKVLSEDEASDLRSKVLDLIPKSVTRDELNRRVRDALQKAGVSAEHLQEKA